jgi:hypothetical protein
MSYAVKVRRAFTELAKQRIDASVFFLAMSVQTWAQICISEGDMIEISDTGLTPPTFMGVRVVFDAAVPTGRVAVRAEVLA